ncbi:MAG: ATP-dependent DNA helicase RecG [Chloroflexota bacterium]
MKPSLDKLYKFFKLEAERSYDNHAVMGGLERMLDRWEAEARAEALPEEIVQAVVTRIRDYSHLTPKSRAEALDGLWRRLQRSFSDLPVLAFDFQEPPPQSPTEDLPEQPGPETSTRKEVLHRRKPTSPAPVEMRSPGEPAALYAPVSVLDGIGPRHAQTLERLGIRTLRDMLYHFPRRYDDYTRMKPINRLEYGEEVTVIGTVQNVSTRSLKGGQLKLTEAIISDGSGALRVTWFNPWIAKSLQSGDQIVLSGKTDQYLGRLVMSNPEWEPLEQQQLSTNRIVPVYPLTAKITQRWLRQQMHQVVSYWAGRVQDPLPQALRQSAELVPLYTALLQIHFPDSWDDLERAIHRLAFDEIFLLQLGALRQKRAWQARTAHPYPVEDDWLQAQLDRLPFSLTNAQLNTLRDVRQDLASGFPMNRLIQGDVGSGKTAVAALAIAIVTSHAAQAAFMAPTSILAEQHYINLQKLLAGQDASSETGSQAASPALDPAQIRLLIGATPEAEKREILAGLSDGSIKVIIGTHALLEDPVSFANLQLAVVDEQHRFGVEQRATLRSKGDNPHLMVMTATPIPRSLALTVYGDLDLSVIDEMPPGRLPVSTHVLMPRERERSYVLIRNQVELGRQAFIIYPLIEESENSETLAAVEEQQRLQSEIFPRLKVGLLHGRMPPEEKDQVMTDFRDGAYHILVSTTVVEVGVDVSNATVMLIEGANRFGLAQLHQLRGRVGRGADKAYCLLIPDSPDQAENDRLRAMTETNDGFILAERDLEQRGPGQFLGTRQSGYADLQLANITDVHLIEKARQHAQALFEQDPELSQPEYALLAETLKRSWRGGKGDIS